MGKLTILTLTMISPTLSSLYFLNCDGSFKANCSSAGIGFILTDTQGNTLIAGCSNRKASNLFLAEPWSIKGLQRAHQEDHSKIWLRSDSHNLIMLSNPSHLPWHLRNLCQDIFHHVKIVAFTGWSPVAKNSNRTVTALAGVA